MYKYKKGFTLVEIVLVIVLIIAMFSMALQMLSSFSKPRDNDKEFNEIKTFLGQIKNLKLLNEKYVSIACNNKIITLYLSNQIIDQKSLKDFTCDKQVSVEPFSLRLLNASSTFEIKINQYGYVIFKRV